MQKLFNEFDNVTATAWKERLAKDLKGVTFEDLISENSSDISTLPFYTKDNLQANAPSALFQHTDWAIVQTIAVTDEKAANALALTLLSQGNSGFKFMLSNAHCDLSVLLADISIAHIYLAFECIDNATFKANLKSYCAQQNVDFTSLNLQLGEDIVLQQLQNTATTVADYLQQNGAEHIVINGAVYLNAGATTTYELACIAAELVEYCTALEAQQQLSNVQSIQINIAVNTQFFEQIAKLRSLRIVVANILKQYNISPKVRIYAVTGSLYKSPVDAYTNMLRDTIAGMAAVIGGCDVLEVLPFDSSFQAPNAFAYRMSTNIQLILKEESYLHHIADIATGAYFLETYTAQICENAWTAFQNIEAKGGFIAQQATIKNTIAAQAEALIESYKAGQNVLIGVNKYPNNLEPKVEYSLVMPKESPLPIINIAAAIL